MVREQREKIQNGQRGIKDLKTRVERECCNSRGGQIVQRRYTGRKSLGRKSQCYEWGRNEGFSSRCESFPSAALPVSNNSLKTHFIVSKEGRMGAPSANISGK